MDEQGAQARVGSTLLGKWTLERLIGLGGMAAVYVGVHKIGRRDAIKILHPEVARGATNRARFEQEAHAVNLLHHPGAVQIHDIDTTEDGAPFLVMELLEGETLLTRVRRAELEPAELLRIVDELLDVLASAHGAGIIHRDIKLDNLFLQADGRLKVLDFGIARMRPIGPALTMTGMALGTAPYMSPEQILGKEVDGRSDLFAVGATMFRLIAKRKVHEAASEQELVVKMATEPAPPLSSIAPEVAPMLAAVVDRALAFDRDHRYPDAITMQADVRALRAGSDPPYATRMAAIDPLGAKPPTSAASASREAPTRIEAPPAIAMPAAAPPASVASATVSLGAPRPPIPGPLSARAGGTVALAASAPNPASVTSQAPPSPAPSSLPLITQPLAPIAVPSRGVPAPTASSPASAHPAGALDRTAVQVIGAVAGAGLLLLILLLLVLSKGSTDAASGGHDAPAADSARLAPGATPRLDPTVAPVTPSRSDPTPRPDPAPSVAPRPAPPPAPAPAPAPQPPSNGPPPPQGPGPAPGPPPGKGHGHTHGHE